VSSTLGAIGRRLELALTGWLPDNVRRNLWIETIASVAFGIFYAAALSFMPVVLRRLGASSTLLAIYTAQTYLGSVLSTLGVLMMRRRRPLLFATAFWLLSRSLLLATALITQADWLLILTAVFWLLEAFPGPAYARVIQAIYPARYRGRALSIVRLGLVLAVLLVTPLAGMALDYIGYRVLFPVGAAIGILATLIFSRLRVDERALPVQQARSLGGVWRLLGQNRRFAIYMLGFALHGLGFLMGLPLFAIVQVDRLQLSYTTLGYLGLAQSLFWLVGNVFWGRLVDRHGGLWVLRANVAVAVLVPLTYSWAFDAWTLLPAFIAHGIISAGIDLALISSGIELADPESVAEYSALQATIIGVRGMIGPFVGVALLGVGVPTQAIFLLGCCFIALGWLALGWATGGVRRAKNRESPRGYPTENRELSIED
jgi:MFS transporter, DHA1 family, inner membrane transport protein